MKKNLEVDLEKVCTSYFHYQRCTSFDMRRHLLIYGRPESFSESQTACYTWAFIPNHVHFFYSEAAAKYQL